MVLVCWPISSDGSLVILVLGSEISVGFVEDFSFLAVTALAAADDYIAVVADGDVTLTLFADVRVIVGDLLVTVAVSEWLRDSKRRDAGS